MPSQPSSWFRAVLSLAIAGVTVVLIFGWFVGASGHAADAAERDDQVAGALAPLVDHAVASAARTTAGAVTVATPPVEPPAEAVYCPAPGSEFVDSWGFARSGGRRHQGVDMMAPHGTPVLAPVSGVVRHSVNDLGGLSFYLLDPHGNEYYGAHLQSLGPSGPVTAGTVLGTVGSSGNASSSGPHLHFEVRSAVTGTINPYPFVEAWCEGSEPTVGAADQLPLP